eukprot:m.48695 g.48695  ORF g.48695 m.48695 type:complete len:332 (-) comp10578_c0_seq2:148-1143(-)
MPNQSQAATAVLWATVAGSILCFIFSIVLFTSAASGDIRRVAWASVRHDGPNKTEAFLGLRKVYVESKHPALNDESFDFDSSACQAILDVIQESCSSCNDANHGTIALNAIAFVLIIVLIVSSFVRLLKSNTFFWRAFSSTIAMVATFFQTFALLWFFEECYHELKQGPRRVGPGFIIAFVSSLQLIFLCVMHGTIPHTDDSSSPTITKGTQQNNEKFIPAGNDIADVVGSFPPQPGQQLPMQDQPLQSPPPQTPAMYLQPPLPQQFQYQQYPQPYAQPYTQPYPQESVSYAMSHNSYEDAPYDGSEYSEDTVSARGINIVAPWWRNDYDA